MSEYPHTTFHETTATATATGRWAAGFYSRPLLFRRAIKLLKTSATMAPRTVAGVLFAWVGAGGAELEVNVADTDSVLPTVVCTLVDQSL